MSIHRYGLTVIFLLTGSLLIPATSDATSSRRELDAQQVQLDEQCQVARESLLSVERAQYIEECVKRKHPRPDRAGCERFYADHGAAAGSRAPLHMDLPECVEAHEFRQNRPRS